MPDKLKRLSNDPQYGPFTHEFPLSGATMKLWRAEVGRDKDQLREKVSVYILSEYGVTLHPEDLENITKFLAFTAIIDVMLPDATIRKLVRLTIP